MMPTTLPTMPIASTTLATVSQPVPMTSNGKTCHHRTSGDEAEADGDDVAEGAQARQVDDEVDEVGERAGDDRGVDGADDEDRARGEEGHGLPSGPAVDEHSMTRLTTREPA